MTTEPVECGICGSNGEHRVFAVREMMFGLRDQFRYQECDSCGCLQLLDVPQDLSPYYPAAYHSGIVYNRVYPNLLKRLAREQRARFLLSGKGLIGKFLVRRYGRPVAPIFGEPDYLSWFKTSKLNLRSKVLEVGSGNGLLLLTLRADGFTNLTGVDKFIPSTIIYPNGVRVVKGTIEELSGQFDCVMLHHTLEHVPDQRTMLSCIRDRLKRGGIALIRIPVCSSHAYRTYGADWAQLDAPRHLFLHTHKSMALLAAAVGLAVESIVSDSTAFQFWASEQYKRDIPLRDERSLMVDSGRRDLFSDSDLKQFEDLTASLNRQGTGDSACFYLRRLED